MTSFAKKVEVFLCKIGAIISTLSSLWQIPTLLSIDRRMRVEKSSLSNALSSHRSSTLIFVRLMQHSAGQSLDNFSSLCVPDFRSIFCRMFKILKEDTVGKMMVQLANALVGCCQNEKYRYLMV